MKKVMIIDGLNMFLRSYINVPSMDKHGAPNGGTYGFMKSLQKSAACSVQIRLLSVGMDKEVPRSVNK